MNRPPAKFPSSPGSMGESEFVDRFGGAYEHSPWVAREAWHTGLDARHDTPAGLSAAMRAVVERAGLQRQLELIRAHPDLAGRAAVRGELNAESTAEQNSAGIDRCTPEEYARFQRLNKQYKGRFGFPFVMAVRGSNRHAILAAFEARLGNDVDTEVLRALSEIHKIARLRLNELTAEPSEHQDG